jgi:hypothetical protein
MRIHTSLQLYDAVISASEMRDFGNCERLCVAQMKNEFLTYSDL